MAKSVSASILLLPEKDILAGLVADIAALRAANALLLAKLDADVGVTDTNYAATVAPAAATVVA